MALLLIIDPIFGFTQLQNLSVLTDLQNNGDRGCIFKIFIISLFLMQEETYRKNAQTIIHKQFSFLVIFLKQIAILLSKCTDILLKMPEISPSSLYLQTILFRWTSHETSRIAIFGYVSVFSRRQNVQLYVHLLVWRGMLKNQNNYYRHLLSVEVG